MTHEASIVPTGKVTTNTKTLVFVVHSHVNNKEIKLSGL